MSEHSILAWLMITALVTVGLPCSADRSHISFMVPSHGSVVEYTDWEERSLHAHIVIVPEPDNLYACSVLVDGKLHSVIRAKSQAVVVIKSLDAGLHTLTGVLHNVNIHDTPWVSESTFELIEPDQDELLKQGPPMVWIQSPFVFGAHPPGEVDVRFQAVRIAESQAKQLDLHIFVNDELVRVLDATSQQSFVEMQAGQTNISVALVAKEGKRDVVLARAQSLLLLGDEARPIVPSVEGSSRSTSGNSEQELKFASPPDGSLYRCSSSDSIPLIFQSQPPIDENNKVILTMDGSDLDTFAASSLSLPVQMLSEGLHTVAITRRTSRGIVMAADEIRFSFMEFPEETGVSGCKVFASVREHHKPLYSKAVPPFAMYALSEESLTSPGGEDGVLRQLFQDIGDGQRLFVEVDPDQAQYSSTHQLAADGWMGLRIGLRSSNNEEGRVLSGFAWADVHQVLTEQGTPSNFDLLSLRTCHDLAAFVAVLEAGFSPRVVLLGYSHSFPYNSTIATIVSKSRALLDFSSANNADPCLGASMGAVTAVAQAVGYQCLHADRLGENLVCVKGEIAENIEGGQRVHWNNPNLLSTILEFAPQDNQVDISNIDLTELSAWLQHYGIGE